MSLFPSHKDKVRDPLFETKLIGTLLTTALIVMTGPVLLYKRDMIANHQAAPAAPAPLSTVPNKDHASDIQDRLQVADIVAGERATALCAACHTFDKGGANMIGPNLWGVVGRDIASVEGAYYSPELQELEGAWTPERLDLFLADPTGYVPGTIMAIDTRQPEKRADIIAYLLTLKD